MNCQKIKQQYQAWSDGDLPYAQNTVVEEHFASCPSCDQYRLEMEAVRGFLSESHTLSEGVSQQLWEKVRPRSSRSRWTDRMMRWSGRLTDWVSFDRRTLLAQLAAAPVALILFGGLSAQFSLPDWQSWTYSVVQVNQDSTGPFAAPVMVHVLQSKPEVRSLIDTAWKLPYEDSFSLVADIHPEGHAQIQSILEPPRSLELLHAVDLTLRTSKFAQAEPPAVESVIIYSFQKIDVYSGL